MLAEAAGVCALVYLGPVGSAIREVLGEGGESCTGGYLNLVCYSIRLVFVGEEGA